MCVCVCVCGWCLCMRARACVCVCVCAYLYMSCLSLSLSVYVFVCGLIYYLVLWAFKACKTTLWNACPWLPVAIVPVSHWHLLLVSGPSQTGADSEKDAVIASKPPHTLARECVCARVWSSTPNNNGYPIPSLLPHFASIIDIYTVSAACRMAH